MVFIDQHTVDNDDNDDDEILDKVDKAWEIQWCWKIFIVARHPLPPMSREVLTRTLESCASEHQLHCMSSRGEAAEKWRLSPVLLKGIVRLNTRHSGK
jgi:hypothetical protein